MDVGVIASHKPGGEPAPAGHRPEPGEGDGGGGSQAASLGTGVLLGLCGAARAVPLLEASAPLPFPPGVWPAPCPCRSLLRCPHGATRPPLSGLLPLCAVPPLKLKPPKVRFAVYC